MTVESGSVSDDWSRRSLTPSRAPVCSVVGDSSTPPCTACGLRPPGANPEVPASKVELEIEETAAKPSSPFPDPTTASLLFPRASPLAGLSTWIVGLRPKGVPLSGKEVGAWSTCLGESVGELEVLSFEK